MLIKVAYYSRIRKDGKYNMVVVDTEKKTYNSWDGGFTDDAVLVEAKQSKDVRTLRNRLKQEGYTDVTPSAS